MTMKSTNVFMRTINKTNKIRLYKHQLNRCGSFSQIKAGDTIQVAYGYEKSGTGQWYGVNDKTKMTSPVDLKNKGVI